MCETTYVRERKIGNFFVCEFKFVHEFEIR